MGKSSIRWSQTSKLIKYGISKDGKKYGTEYTTLLKSGNIKFVRHNNGKSAKTPMETMTKGRVYVTVSSTDKLKSITYYDDTGKRRKQIDLNHYHKSIKENHAHEGYEHEENGTHRLTDEERAMVDRVKRLWYNQKARK